MSFMQNLPCAMGVLPAVFLAACAAVVAAARPRLPFRDAAIIACTITGLWLVAGTELLSALHSLDSGPLTLWWGIPTAGLGLLALRTRRRRAGWLDSPGRPDRTTLLILAAAASILLTTWFVAATTPANTWDCLAYHLPRQFYWVQNRTVAPFPAHDLRQVEMPPFAEFAGAHLMILSGGDAWANMIQWAALLGASVVASAAARDLGAGARGQALAALLVAANPAAPSQAVNGKNDVVLALWICILAYSTARMILRPTRGLVFLIGGSLGLALLTKGTAYFFAAPLCAAVAWAMLARWRTAGLAAGAAACLLALSLNAGHFARNQAVVGSPLGTPESKGGYALRNATISAPALASNIIRNVALHTGTPSNRINQWQFDRIAESHEWLGISPHDPATTAPRSAQFEIVNKIRGDGESAAPIHLLLAIGLLAAAAARPASLTGRPAWPVLAAPYAAFFLFCLLLRWQPWHGRLHIPVVSLFAIAAGVALSRGRVAPVGIIAGLAAAALTWPTLLWNLPKPLAGPGSVLFRTGDDILFQGGTAHMEATARAAATITSLNPTIVGLNLPNCPFEYPAQRAILAAVRPRPTIVNLNANFARSFGPGPQVPDVVLAWCPDGLAPLRHQTSGAFYLPFAIHPPWAVYIKPDALAARGGPLPGPPFGGWTAEEGLEPPEGPLPQFDLPIVRWAKGPRTLLTFTSTGAPARLVMDCRRNDRPDQELVVSLNGTRLYHFSFGTPFLFTLHDIPLAPRPGPNEVLIEYLNCNEPGPPRSALYKQLQIVPGRGGQAAAP